MVEYEGVSAPYPAKTINENMNNAIKIGFVLSFAAVLSFVARTKKIDDGSRGVAIGLLAGGGVALSYVAGSRNF